MALQLRETMKRYGPHKLVFPTTHTGLTTSPDQWPTWSDDLV